MTAGLVLATVAALSACATPATTGASTTAQTAALKSLTFINPAPAQEPWQVAAQCFTDAAKAAGITPKVVGSPGSNTVAADQLRFIEQAVADGTDGIVSTSFASSTALEAAYKAAQDKGIYVATMESGDATQARNFDVGLDIVQFAKDMADQVASQPGQHKVAILVQSQTGTPKIFSDAFQAQAATHDNVTLTQIVTDNGLATSDADVVNSLLTAHPEVTDIVSPVPAATAGIVTAIKERDKVGQVSLTGNGVAEPAPSALQDGTAEAFYAQKMCDVGTLAVKNMIALSEGQTVARSIPVETQFVTKGTLAALDQKVWF